MLSVLDLFRIGIGPSSSHTVGPIRIAARFVNRLVRHDKMHAVTSVEVELQGSLALTGGRACHAKSCAAWLDGACP